MQSTLRIILSIATLVIATAANAQGTKLRKTAQQHITGTPFNIYYMMYEGYPFTNENWTNGSVTLISGETYSDLQLKYDALREDVVYYNSLNHNMISIDKDIITQFELSYPNGITETFKCLTGKGLGNNNGKYFAIIYEDSISLVTKYITRIQNNSNANPASRKTGELLHREENYIWDKQTLQTVPRSRSKLIKLYPQFKDELRHFASKNHIKMRSKADVAKMIEELNRLIANKK